jgi:hypothetical protein
MKLSKLPVLASLVLFGAPVLAQGSILPYLPKDTMMAVSAPDLGTSLAEFQKMPLAKMWAEQEVQNFVADVREMVSKQIEQGLAQAKEMHAQGALPVDPEQLMKLRIQGGTFAITQMAMGMGDMGPMPKFGFVLHLDFGATAPQWNALIEMGLGMLEQQAKDEMTKTDKAIGDVHLLTFRPNDAPQGLEMGLNVALVPGGVLLGTLAEDLEGVLKNMQGKTPVLGASDAYRATAKHLNTDGAEVESFIRLDPIADFIVSTLRLGTQMSAEMSMVDVDGIERAMAAMGCRNLVAMGATANYVDGKSVGRTFAARAKKGTEAPAKNVDMSFLKWVPSDAVSFGAGTLDIASIYDTLLAGLKAYDENLAKTALEHLAAIETEVGFKVREDFFGSFGDHYVTWSMPMGAITSAPEMAFLLKITDEQKLVTVLKNLAKLSNGMVEIEEGEKRGLKAYQLRVNFDPTEGMGMNPFDVLTPTFAFKNGYMVLGFSASDVKRVFARMDREDDPKGDIRSNKEFAAVAGQLPAAMTSVSFTDWKAQFESFYQIATGLLAFVPMGEDIPIDMALLPDSGTLTKHLFGSVSYGTTTEDGAVTVTVSPFGPETMLLIGALAAGAAATVGYLRAGF